MKVDHDPVESPDAVDVLVAEYLDALDHGSAPSRSDWLGMHPECADELASFLDDLERLSPVRPQTARVDETQMLSGDQPNIPVVRDSETIVWRSANAGAEAASSGRDMPFGGAFGDYDLLQTIARGGMGVVFKARHRRLDRVVALKMILAGNLAGQREIQRFQAEAQAAAKLDHPGIVPVYEVGQEQGLHYFTMAFVEGKSLAARLVDGPLPPKEAARLVRELAAAIAYAHEHGIVHRDLKPANVLIDATGQPKLTDFGLAKQTQSGSDMTGTGQILGTPGYMPPEQAQGDAMNVGPAADVYGLGALLFALLTGRPPFQGSSSVETIQHVISADPPKPRALNPGVPRDLETICLKCLEKSPHKRYVDAIALKEDLDRFLDDQPILARPVGVLERTYRWYRRRPVVGTMAATLALLLFAVPMLLGGMLVEAEGRAKAEKDGHDNEKKARETIQAAERERTKQLFQAYVNEAAARRTSPRVGRAFETINRVIAARDLADDLKLPAEDYTRMRSEAFGAASLIDLRATKTGPGWLLGYEPYQFACIDGKGCSLAWDKPNGLLVRRQVDGKVLQRVPVENTVWDNNYVRLSPDNRFVSSQVHNKLVIWQVDGDKPKEIARHDGVAWALFAPDRAEMIVYTHDRTAKIQPLEEKAEVITIRIPDIVKETWPTYWQMSMRPGPRRQLAVAGLKRVHLVDLDAHKVTATFPIPAAAEDIVWTRAGDTVAVASPAQGIVLFQPANKSHRLLKTTVGGPERLCFDADGQLLLAYNEWTNYCSLVNVAQGNVALRFHYTELSSTPLHRSPAWWQGTADCVHRAMSLTPQDGGPQHMHSAVHPGGRLLAAATSAGIVLNDLATGRRVGFLPGHSLYCRFDGDGNLYAQRAGPNGGVCPYRWTINVKENRYDISKPERIDLAHGAGLAVTADGRFVAEGGNNGAAVLDRETGKTFALEPQHDVRHLVFHPQKPWLATFGFSSHGFRIWDAQTGKILHAAGGGGFGHGKFTPDGKYLIAHGSEQPGLTLWSMPDCQFVRHLGPLGAFAVSPDSRYIAVAEVNGKMRFTRIADGTLIARFDAPGEDYVGDATFSPDGRYLVGSNIDRDRQHIWDLWKLRHRLADMKLDWEKEAAPPVPAVSAALEAHIEKQ